MTTLAAATREAVDANPFVRTALRAGILNYSAAARFLEVDGGEEAIATALRRYAEELPPIESRDGRVRVTMQSGVGRGDGSVLSIGDDSFAEGAGEATVIQAVGDVDASLFGTIANRLGAASVEVLGMGLIDNTLVVVVERADGTTALSIVEEAAEGIR